jgi:hypothetical protein
MNNYSKLSNKSPQLGTFGPNRREIESLQSGGEDRGTGVHKYRLSFMWMKKRPGRKLLMSSPRSWRQKQPDAWAAWGRQSSLHAAGLDVHLGPGVGSTLIWDGGRDGKGWRRAGGAWGSYGGRRQSLHVRKDGPETSMILSSNLRGWSHYRHAKILGRKHMSNPRKYERW